MPVQGCQDVRQSGPVALVQAQSQERICLHFGFQSGQCALASLVKLSSRADRDDKHTEADNNRHYQGVELSGNSHADSVRLQHSMLVSM